MRSEIQPDRPRPCDSTQHCAVHGWCHRCDPVFATLMSLVNKTVLDTDVSDEDWSVLYRKLGEVLRAAPNVHSYVRLAPGSAAYRIRAELVCCHIYERVNDTKELTLRQAIDSPDWHGICYWGEAAARLAENRPRADSFAGKQDREPAPVAEDLYGLTVQQHDALWDAVAIPGPTAPTFVMQHERVLRTVSGIIDEMVGSTGILVHVAETVRSMAAEHPKNAAWVQDCHHIADRLAPWPLDEEQARAERRERFAEAMYNTLESSPDKKPWAELSSFRRVVWYTRADAAIAVADTEADMRTAVHHTVGGIRYLCHTDDHHCPSDGQEESADVRLARAQELHRASCLVAQHVVEPKAFACDMCEALGTLPTGTREGKEEGVDGERSRPDGPGVRPVEGAEEGDT